MMPCSLLPPSSEKKGRWGIRFLSLATYKKTAWHNRPGQQLLFHSCYVLKSVTYVNK